MLKFESKQKTMIRTLLYRNRFSLERNSSVLSLFSKKKKENRKNFKAHLSH